MDHIRSSCTLLEQVLCHYKPVQGREPDLSVKKVILVYKHPMLRPIAHIEEIHSKFEVKLLFRDTYTYLTMSAKDRLRKVSSTKLSFLGIQPMIYALDPSGWCDVSEYIEKQRSKCQEIHPIMLAVPPAEPEAEPEAEPVLVAVEVEISQPKSPLNIRALDQRDWRRRIHDRMIRSHYPMRLEAPLRPMGSYGPRQINVVMMKRRCGKGQFLQYLDTVNPRNIHTILGFPNWDFISTLRAIPKETWNRDMLIVDYLDSWGDDYWNRLNELTELLYVNIPDNKLCPDKGANLNCAIWMFVSMIPKLAESGTQGRWNVFQLSDSDGGVRQLVTQRKREQSRLWIPKTSFPSSIQTRSRSVA